MKILLTILISVFITIGQLFGQADKFIDSLKSKNVENILLFKTNCVGCIVMKPECDSYVDNGNPWDQYVIWKISKNYYIKKFNKCGTSKTVHFLSWINDPFLLIKTNLTDLDTNQIQYPLSYSQKSNTWFETDINHFKSYEFSFPTFSIENKKIKDYAFREIKEIDESFASVDIESERNLPRFKKNNNSSIKKLLDMLLDKLNALDKKLRIN